MPIYCPKSTAIQLISVSDAASDYTVKDHTGTHRLRNKHEVTVTFTDGKSASYLLSPNDVDAFINADSVGKHYNACVRNGWWVTL